MVVFGGGVGDGDREVLVAVVRQVVMRVETIHFEKRTIVMLPE